MSWGRLFFCGGAALLALVARAGETPEPEPPWPEVRAATFALVWETVNEAYFDPQFGGVDWAAVRERYAAELPAATDKAGLRGLLQRMLGELGKSHFAILPREATVFTPEERSRVGTAGLEVGWVEDAVVVLRVDAGGPAAQAGLTPGEVVRSAAGHEVERLARVLAEGGAAPATAGRMIAQWVQGQLRAPVGSAVELSVERPPEPPRPVAVVTADHPGEWTEPVGNFPALPLRWETELTDGIGVARFNVYARQVMRPLREFFLALPAEGGLVLDLRGNGGGLSIMAAGLSGYLCERQTWLGTMQLRQGMLQFVAYPQTGAFRGPLAVLVDGGTASTAEIMAAGLQAAGRARVFGERSAGQALPSAFKQLPSGDLFQYAIADVKVGRGVSLEGAGVEPDESVRRTRADLAAGRDPVLARAKEWLRSSVAASTNSGVTGR